MGFMLMFILKEKVYFYQNKKECWDRVEAVTKAFFWSDISLEIAPSQIEAFGGLYLPTCDLSLSNDTIAVKISL